VIDLQCHSTVSDGELPPEEVVGHAAAAGVTTMSLTDHDAIDGIAIAVQTGRELGIECIPAIEMSCVHAGADDLHMLGYGIEPSLLANACSRAQDERRHRAAELISNLNAVGVEVTLEDAIARAGDASSVGRPHIAKAAGVQPEGMGEFFEKYLVPGAPTFVSRRWPAATEAIKLIHSAGGAAVIAHPFWDISDPAEVGTLIEDLVAAGVDGIESYYPVHDREQTRFLLDRCAEHDLCATASADFHGPGHKHFSRFGAYETFGLGEPELPRRRGALSQRSRQVTRGA